MLNWLTTCVTNYNTQGIKCQLFLESIFAKEDKKILMTGDFDKYFLAAGIYNSLTISIQTIGKHYLAIAYKMEKGQSLGLFHLSNRF